MRKVVVLILFGFWLMAADKTKALEGGLGVCHYDGADGLNMGTEVVNWFYWGGGPFDWAKIEPTKGVYSFTASEQLLNSLFAKRPKVEYWADVQTALVPSVPEWAKSDYYGYQPYGTSSKRSFFIPWNENYLGELDKLLGQVRKYFDDPGTVAYKNRDKLTAISIMGGGPNGEMITGGFPADQRERIGYTDEKYYQAVMRIVAMYVKHFGGFRPVVLQLGSGAYGKPDFMDRVARDVVALYGNQVWLKYNGWNEAINAELVAYNLSDTPTTIDLNSNTAFKFKNSKVRNIKSAKVRIKSKSNIGNVTARMLISDDAGGKPGTERVRSKDVNVLMDGLSHEVTFDFVNNANGYNQVTSLYLGHDYWIKFEGISQAETETVPISGWVTLDGGVSKEGVGLNWKMIHVFRDGLSVHRLMTSLANKTRVGFEPGQFGTGNQSYPVQNSGEVIYNSIMETVNPNWVSKYPANSSGRSDFYVPISYLCLQNDYYGRSGISREQFAKAASYIRANASKAVGVVPTSIVAVAGGGDANSDGQVDMADLGIWKAEYINQNGLKADFNRDGRVDMTDLGIWKTEYLK